MLSTHLANPGETAPNSAIKKRTSRKFKEANQVRTGRIGKKTLPNQLRSKHQRRQSSQETGKESVGWWTTQKDAMRVFTLSDPPAGSRLGGIEESPSGRWVYVHADPPEALKPLALTRILDKQNRRIRQTFPSGYTVGSSQKMDIRPACPHVENMHCIIYSRVQRNSFGQTFFVADRSKKGTWLNGAKLAGACEQQLKDGDVLQFVEPDTAGAVKLIIRIPRIKLISNVDVEQLYDFKETIGRSRCGLVKVAQCKKTNKLYACKMIHPTPDQRTLNAYRETLLQEISVYMALKSHPCVMQIREVVEQNLKIYIFMELIKDGDLHDYVSSCQPPMTEDEVKIIFDQLFHATHFFHESNLIHRDLKLENVLMVDKEKLFVKITDLGLAKFMPDSDDSFSTICGTQLYAAPELLRRRDGMQAKFTSKVDIWCLGMMLYICLTGRHPFLDTHDTYTASETLRCIESNPVTCVDKQFDRVSDEGIDLVKRLLAIDPEERPTIAEILKHPWLDRIESPRTQLKGLVRSPALVEYLAKMSSSKDKDADSKT